jgi:hypothetical protein
MDPANSTQRERVHLSRLHGTSRNFTTHNRQDTGIITGQL